MGDDFLADNNPCGQCILQLVSRGNAIIAELLRLKDYIPPVFRWDKKQDQQKYCDIISDFSYFKASDEFDKRIESNPLIQDLDDEFRENHIEILTRFYSAFENIQKFAVDLNSFVDDLEDGSYIQQTLETILLNEEGRQLVCESVFLYGVMLIVVDLHIPGDIRERMLVSYYRYTAEHSTNGSNVDDVCKLLRSTGFSLGKRPPNYPEDFFRRTPLRDELVSLVIGRLRSDDIYNQISAYPYTEHRSTALANQAAMLYVCLYFQPNILHNQTARMRETVDKYFPDNWVISIYMGLTVNLIDAWEPYKAARMALANTLEPSNVQEHATYHARKFEQCIKIMHQKLKAGGLTKSSVFEHVDKIINVIRNGNVTLRWLMLHTISTCCVCEPTKKSKQIRDTINEVLPKQTHIFQLLLDTSEFELRIKELFKTLLHERESDWEQCKKEANERMNELSRVFSGENTLVRVEKDDNLKKWFSDIASQINSLNIDEPIISGRKIVQLIQALEEVQGFPQLFNNQLVTQSITESKKFLHQMVQGSNVKETVLINLQIMGDLSYAWNIIDNYTNLMQSCIKKEPSLVSKLRATFLKLSSAMEIPLLRINQAQSPDLVSVSQYYSHELVSYIRGVVQIIPETMFKLMAEIVHLQTMVLQELPTRLDKDRLKEYAQLGDRLKVAKLTHQVSVFTEGILRMKSTLVGIVRIDPKQLLEDGIRKELVHHLASALHNGLTFNPKAKVSELGEKLKQLGEIMDGHRRSFEYIQDYIDIYGLKIWQEELSRVIGYSVDMECNSFLRLKIHEWQSIHQNKAIPIPSFPPSPSDPHSVNFIGRLARELIRITDPRTTVYVESAVAWFDQKTQKEVVDLKLFSKIRRSVSTSGLTGLDRLISFMIVTELQSFLGTFQKGGLLKEKATVEHLSSAAKTLSPNTANISNPSRVYPQLSNKLQKMWPQYLDSILRVGQLQLLRKHIFYELRTACKFESKPLASALETMNQALLNEIKEQYKAKGMRTTTPAVNSALLAELTAYMDWAGIGDPFAKIYVTTKNINYFPLFSFLFVISQLQKITFDKNIGLIWKKSGDPLDGIPFIIGLQTIFRHFHPEIRSQLLLYLGQYVNSYVEATVSAGYKSSTAEFPSEVTVTLQFLRSFVKYSGLPRTAITQHIPEPILDLFHSGFSAELN